MVPEALVSRKMIVGGYGRRPSREATMGFGCLDRTGIDAAEISRKSRSGLLVVWIREKGCLGA